MLELKLNHVSKRGYGWLLMATYIWFSIGSTNGLLWDGTQPPEPILTKVLCGIHFKAIPHLIHNMCPEIELKIITILLPDANVLKQTCVLQ